MDPFPLLNVPQNTAAPPGGGKSDNGRSSTPKTIYDDTNTTLIIDHQVVFPLSDDGCDDSKNRE